MATVHCSKCTAERKGFRRELDSWRHKLIHCIGFESILEGIYGPLLLRDLNLFDDCEPEEVIDWSPEESSSQCSLCNLSLDKHNDQVLSATSPLSSPSDYSPRHVPFLSESSQSAHKFLQAVFHKKDMPQDYDPNIPLIAQELMKKMIHQFAMEYASKCLLHTTSNGHPRKISPLSETADAPLDLTVSRAQELKEPQPDGVLDLSNRKSASLPTSKPSVSINHKGSGCCLSTIVQEPGEPKHQGTKNSALGAVLGLLCPAHQSLVYRILKLAHQQKLLFFQTLKQVKHECHCCHCGKHCDNHISHYGAMSECTPCGCCQHWLNDHCSSRYPPEDSKYPCSTHPFVLKVCGHETARDSNRCSVQLCKSETCTNTCHKKVHCHSCQSHSPNNIDSAVCTYRPTVLSPSSTLTLCPLSVCCSQHNNQTCSCQLIHSSLTEVNSTKCREDESVISIVKSECSASLSLLPAIPADLNKEGNESSQGHDHIQEQEAEPVRDECPCNANFKKGSVKRQKCKTTKSCSIKRKVSGIFLQDINLFSDKLETIKSSERGVSVAAASVAEKSHLQSAPKNVQMSTDAHMTEIITTVLHTGSASGYCLTELIDHQRKEEPQAPNTRSRRRHEVLSAVATLGGDATNRRGTQMKQDLERLDQSYSKQKTIKKRENPSLNSDNCEVANCKTVKKLDKDNGSSSYSKNKNVQCPLKPNHSGKSRKSKRTIVPPPRFSSYVTEPRKMYFVACFSDSIFRQKSQTGEIVTLPQRSESFDGSSASHNAIEHSQKTQNEATQTSIKEQSPIHNHFDTQAEETLADVTIPSPSSLSHDDTCVKYTSPIKLMFISPLNDKEGMKYSLKSAASVNGLQADEYFDPCEESSWSGTPEKNTSQGILSTMKASPLKSSSSPAKRACVLARSSPNKTSPNKSSPTEKSGSTPKSIISSPKIGLRRSGESSPTKCAAVDDTPRSLHDVSALHETTPPKRRPGRPKKLGPQLEKKVKRPIGRPRKEKVMQSIVNEKSVNGNTVAPDMEENVNKNLKITVLYGRSRRNKRMVSEGFDQLQTEFHDACQAVGLNNKWSMLMNTAKMNSTDLKTAPDGLSQEIPLMKPAKVCAKSNIKCQSLDNAAPLRKPGRPAKVKISGISVTVTTVSPRQRKIQINKDKSSPVRHNYKKALFQQSSSAKEPKTITRHSLSKSSVLETEEPKVESKIEPNPPVAIRHSERVRKPSIHFLHAVATSSSYSRGSALVRCSKQLLVNRANCEQKKEKSQSDLQTSGEPEIKQKVGMTRCLGIHHMSSVSVESVYSPKEVKWWSASVQEKTLNQELARRIRLISDSWVSPTAGTEAGSGSSKNSSASSRKSKHSSVVRSLFDCSPNKPRSCSMQQLCSWFMQTTETQSLTIVKKASSRNSYELMHFPRSSNKKSVCYSPQAERLRKHLKKFAKSFPQSPYDFKQSQKKMNKKHSNISHSGRHNQMSKRKHKSSNTYQVTLYRAKRRFFTRKERKRWMNSKTQCTLNKRGTRLQPLPKLTSKPLPSRGLPLVPAHAAKDDLSSKHASPETLKECRVFLRKIHSLNNGLAVVEETSSTDTLDDGSPSLLQCITKDKAVKTDQIKSSKRACLKDSVQAQHVEPMRRRSHSVGVVSESTPPAKRLRQSRMRGLSGPRWRDFVFGN